MRIVALYHMGLLELRAGNYGAARESFGQLATDHIRSKELTTGMGLAALLMEPQDSPPTARRALALCKPRAKMKYS